MDHKQEDWTPPLAMVWVDNNNTSCSVIVSGFVLMVVMYLVLLNMVCVVGMMDVVVLSDL